MQWELTRAASAAALVLLAALPIQGRAEYAALKIAVEGEVGPGGEHVWFAEALGEDPNGGVWALVGTDGNLHGLKSLVRFHDDGDVEVASKDFFLDVLELGGANTQGRQALRYRDFPGPVTIARTTGTALETIAATGDPVPAPFTGTWTTLGRSCIDDAGAVYFGGTFGDGMTETKGLFRRASPTSALELLVVSGHPVPGAGVVVLFPEFFECDASETGALLFVAWTDLPEPQSRGVFWRSAGGSTLAAVVLETDTRPDGVSIGFLDRVEINDTLFLIGGWTTFTFGSYFALAGEFSGGTPCCLRSIAPWNQPTPVGLAYHDGVVATISPSGDIAFTAQVGPPVFQGGPPHVRMLFRESGAWSSRSSRANRWSRPRWSLRPGAGWRSALRETCSSPGTSFRLPIHSGPTRSRASICSHAW